MIRSLSIWPEIVAFLATWPQWHHARHAPAPTRASMLAAYDDARRRHHGQRAAWMRLRDATNEALRRSSRIPRRCDRRTSHDGLAHGRERSNCFV